MIYCNKNKTMAGKLALVTLTVTFCLASWTASEFTCLLKPSVGFCVADLSEEKIGTFESNGCCKTLRSKCGLTIQCLLQKLCPNEYADLKCPSTGEMLKGLDAEEEGNKSTSTTKKPDGGEHPASASASTSTTGRPESSPAPSTNPGKKRNHSTKKPTTSGKSAKKSKSPSTTKKPAKPTKKGKSKASTKKAAAGDDDEMD